MQFTNLNPDHLYPLHPLDSGEVRAAAGLASLAGQKPTLAAWQGAVGTSRVAATASSTSNRQAGSLPKLRKLKHPWPFLAIDDFSVDHTNDVGMTALMHAVSVKRYSRTRGQPRENLRLLQTLVRSGASVRRQTRNGWTPLMYAVNGGCAESVGLLLDYCPDMAITSCSSVVMQTPLMLAAQNGHRAILGELLRLGKIDVNQRDSQGWSAMTYARCAGHRDITADLLGHGGQSAAGAPAMTPGFTRLMLAARTGQQEEVAALLASDRSDLFHTDRLGDNACSHAASAGHLHIVEFLLAASGEHGYKLLLSQTMLFKAVASNWMELLALYTERRHRINEFDMAGLAPLHVAASHGNETCIRMLLEAGGQCDMRSRPAGHTPLFIAAYRGHQDCVRTLLSMGADSNALAGNGASALLAAIDGEHVDIVRLLLQAGADVEVQLDACQTRPVLLACSKKNREILDLLIDAGAQTGVANRWGLTPRQCAIGLGLSDIVERLDCLVTPVRVAPAPVQ